MPPSVRGRILFSNAEEGIVVSFPALSLRAHRRRESRTCRFESLEARTMLSATPPTVVDVSVASTQWTSDFLGYLASNGFGDHGYSLPVGSAAQSDAVPWINIDQILVEFSEDVNIDMADLALTGSNTTSYSFADFSYDPQQRLATWTLATSLTRDRLMIDLNADGLNPIDDLDGNLLDGEWTNESSTYASGNGTAGGDFDFTLNVLPGDADSSGAVTFDDYVYVRAWEGTYWNGQHYNALRDVDGDGDTDSADWQAVFARIGHALPSANPAGVNNDAPTTTGFDLVDIDDAAIDVAVSLFNRFDDAEDGSSGLTYSIVSNSNAALFDSVSINSGQGNLVLNAASGASGRAEIVVRAVDSGGIAVTETLTVDVMRDNAPPEILNFVGVNLGAGRWAISGDVIDSDDDPEGWIVTLSGEIDERVRVKDGKFSILVQLDPDATGVVTARTSDPHGEASNEPWIEINLT